MTDPVSVVKQQDGFNDELTNSPINKQQMSTVTKG